MAGCIGIGRFIGRLSDTALVLMEALHFLSFYLPEVLASTPACRYTEIRSTGCSCTAEVYDPANSGRNETYSQQLSSQLDTGPITLNGDHGSVCQELGWRWSSITMHDLRRRSATGICLNAAEYTNMVGLRELNVTKVILNMLSKATILQNNRVLPGMPARKRRVICRI